MTDTETPEVEPLAVGTVPNVAADQPIASAWGNTVADTVNFLRGPPACRVYRTSPQTAASGLTTIVFWDQERYDTAGMFPGTGDRVTLPVAGLYLVSACVQFSPNGTGVREVFLESSVGATRIASELCLNNGAAQPTRFSVGPSLWKFAAGEFVRLVVYHDAGATLNLENAAASCTEMAVVWVGVG